MQIKAFLCINITLSYLNNLHPYAKGWKLQAIYPEPEISRIYRPHTTLIVSREGCPIQPTTEQTLPWEVQWKPVDFFIQRISGKLNAPQEYNFRKLKNNGANRPPYSRNFKLR